MDQLAVVQARLGSVDSWPPYVLRFIFMLESNSRVMKKVAALCREKVRLCDAVACYNACNGRNQSRVETALRAWHVVWDRDVNQSHSEQ